MVRRRWVPRSSLSVVKLRPIALAVAVLVSGVACADVTGSAIEVNGEEISRGDVVDLLTAISDDVNELENVPASLQTPVGTFEALSTAQIVSLMIEDEVYRQALSARSIDVTQAEIDAALAASEPGLSASFDAFSAELRARGAAIQAAELDPNDLFLDADVAVDPRFGTWDPASGQVFPNPSPLGL